MTQSKDLVIVRTLNAPQHLVWHAWSDAEHLKKWWGPQEYTCPDMRVDFRIGGKFHGSMMDAEGKKIWSTGTYKEIDPKTKIVFTDSFSNEKGDIVSGEEYGMGDVPLEMMVTVLLKDLGDKTEMTLIHSGLPASHMEGATAGWGSSIDKMEESIQQS